MVLFKEDDDRIKAMEKAEKLAKRGPVQRWIRRLIKISIVLGILLFIGLTVLSRLGGDSEHLKNGVQEYLANATDLDVEIQSFHHLKFFPHVELSAEDIVMRERNENAKEVFRADKFYFKAGFFDLMLSKDLIKELEINNAFVSKNITGYRDLIIDKAVTMPKAYEGNKPGLFANGRWGADPVAFEMEMNVRKDGDKIVAYEMPETGGIKANIGDLVFAGLIEGDGRKGLTVNIEKFGKADVPVSGKIFSKAGWGALKINADLKAGRSHLDASFKIKEELLEGSLSFSELHIEDISLLSELSNMLADLKKDGTYEVDEPVSLPDDNIDLKIKAEKIMANGQPIGHATLPVTISDQILVVKNISGKLSGGTLSGNVMLDARSSQAKFSNQLTLKNWDYGLIQKIYRDKENISGTANIHIALKGQGQTTSDIFKNLSGDIVMIAGEGKFESAALNIWGGGLVKAMIPNIGDNDLTTLNCMIADFKVEEGIAKPAPFFADTARLTVVGEGEINLATNEIDMVMEPKAKGAAFLDIATAVNIKGPLQSPKISPNGFSVLEKIGGLALGAINPAFLAISLTDLGLTDNHPCYEFIGAPEDDKKSATQTPASPEEDNSEDHQQTLVPDNRMATPTVND